MTGKPGGAITGMALAFAVAGSASGDAAERSVRVALRPGCQAVTGLSDLLVALKTLRYCETLIDKGRGLPSWLRAPLRNAPAVVTADSSDEAVALFRELLPEGIGLRLHGGEVLVATEQALDPLLAETRRVNYDGSPREFLPYVAGIFGVRLYEPPGGIWDAHPGILTELTNVNSRRGRVQGEMTLRDACIVYCQATGLDMTARYHLIDDMLYIEAEMAFQVPAYSRRMAWLERRGRGDDWFTEEIRLPRNNAMQSKEGPPSSGGATSDRGRTHVPDAVAGTTDAAQEAVTSAGRSWLLIGTGLGVGLVLAATGAWHLLRRRARSGAKE